MLDKRRNRTVKKNLPKTNRISSLYIGCDHREVTLYCVSRHPHPARKRQRIPVTTEALLRLPEVKRLCGLSRSSVYRLMELGQFPRSVPLSMRAVAWPRSSIEKFIKERIDAGRERTA